MLGLLVLSVLHGGRAHLLLRLCVLVVAVPRLLSGLLVLHGLAIGLLTLHRLAVGLLALHGLAIGRLALHGLALRRLAVSGALVRHLRCPRLCSALQGSSAVLAEFDVILIEGSAIAANHGARLSLVAFRLYFSLKFKLGFMVSDAPYRLGKAFRTRQAFCLPSSVETSSARLRNTAVGRPKTRAGASRS